MAGKAPYGAYGGPPAQGPPPPYQQYPQPSGQSTVVVQHTVVQQKPARGFLGSLMKEVDTVGRQLGKEIDYMGNKINQAVDASRNIPLLSMFGTGNVVQLVGRSTGRALEIVMGDKGQLILDGNGPVDRNAHHATWVVVNEGNNQVRLHNNHNYLTVVNGHTTLINMPPGVMHGIETKWQLTVTLEQNFVLLESMKERGRHLGILPTGQLKPALACGRENDAHFGVQLVWSPQPQTVTVVHKK